MATHISFTLPVDLSPEQEVLLKEMFQLALRKFGRNIVRPKMQDVFSEEKKKRIEDLAALARLFDDQTAGVHIVDEYNESQHGCCPCCGVDRGYLRGPGSIW
jgi:hypothetical protein